MRSTLARLFVSALLAAALPGAGAAQDAGEHSKAALEKALPKNAPYSPYAGRSYPTRPFFGDTHLHTSYSMDAGAFGARLTPADAFRFARGEVVTSTGELVAVDARTLCLHSDTPGAVGFARAVAERLRDAGVEIRTL